MLKLSNSFSLSLPLSISFEIFFRTIQQTLFIGHHILFKKRFWSFNFNPKHTFKLIFIYWLIFILVIDVQLSLPNSYLKNLNKFAILRTHNIFISPIFILSWYFLIFETSSSLSLSRLRIVMIIIIYHLLFFPLFFQFLPPQFQVILSPSLLNLLSTLVYYW